MARRRHRAWWIHWGVWSLLLALLYLANVPFYSGSSFCPHWSWRMEHGRLKLARSEVTYSESFYIDANTEGIKLAPEATFHSFREWSLNVPLWIPLALLLGVTLWSYRAARRHAHAAVNAPVPGGATTR